MDALVGTGRPRTADKIIQTTLQLTLQHSFSSTSMDDIAGAVGMKKASLYHHFDSREQLLNAVLKYHQQHFAEHVITQLAHTPEPEPKKQILLDYYATQQGTCLIMQLMHEAISPSGELHHYAQQHYANWLQLLAEYFPDRANTTTDALLTYAQIVGALTLDRIDSNCNHFAQVIRRL